MSLKDRIAAFFSPREVVIERRWTPMTPKQREHFDRAFAKMDEAFAELDKVFRP